MFYIVCIQVLIRRELEEAAKTLGDRVRQKDATCEVRTFLSFANLHQNSYLNGIDLPHLA